MFVVTVEFTVAEERLRDFVPLIQDNAAMSLTREPDCHRFDVCQSPDKPNMIFLYEIYEDSAAFERHKTMPHFLDFSEATEHMVTSKTVQTYRRIDAGTGTG